MTGLKPLQKKYLHAQNAKRSKATARGGAIL